MDTLNITYNVYRSILNNMSSQVQPKGGYLLAGKSDEWYSSCFIGGGAIYDLIMQKDSYLPLLADIKRSDEVAFVPWLGVDKGVIGLQYNQFVHDNLTDICDNYLVALIEDKKCSLVRNQIIKGKPFMASVEVCDRIPDEADENIRQLERLWIAYSKANNLTVIPKKN